MASLPRRLLTLIVALAACTGPSATAPVAPAPSAAESTPSSLPPETRVQPPRDPLVFAMHPTRPPIDVSLGAAERLISGSFADWRSLGERSGPLWVLAGPGIVAGPGVLHAAAVDDVLARVREDRDAVGIVPASAVDASVRVMTVGGVDPLLAPHDHPLMTAGPEPGPVTTMIAVGDIMLARRVGRSIEATDDPAFPLRLVAERLSAADIAVGNVENTFARLGPPTQGDAFAADPRGVEGLVQAGFDVVSLANNHVGDFGSASLVETVRVIEDAGIATFGAGADEAGAREPAIVERNGIRFGFVGFNAIGETPPPDANRPGAVRIRMQPRLGQLNERDLARMAGDVEALRARADVVVVMPHWGAQYTHRIHRDQRTVGRAMLRAGADVVLGGHPHWVQGFELFRGAPIVHSLGNFVFDMDFMRKTNEAIAVELIWWGDRLKAMTPIPVRIDDDFRPRFLSWERGASILDDVFGSSRPPWRS